MLAVEKRMADTNSVDLVLDFLRKNRFTGAEAALRTELGNRPDLNGLLEKLSLENKDSSNSVVGENGGKPVVENQGLPSVAGEVAKELIVKEIQCGTGVNGSESKWKNASTSSSSSGERSKVSEAIKPGEKGFTFYKNSEDTVLDLHSWKFSSSNGTANQYAGGENSTNAGKTTVKPEEGVSLSSEKKTPWSGSTSKHVPEQEHERTQISESKELDQHLKTSGGFPKDSFTDSLWSRSEEAAPLLSDVWKDCPVKTVFPFSKVDASVGNDSGSGSSKKEGKRKAVSDDVRAAIKEQVDEVGRTLFFGKTQGSSEHKEELPRLPPVKLKSEDKLMSVNWEEKYDRDCPVSQLSAIDSSLLIGSYLDVPIGQEISSAG